MYMYIYVFSYSISKRLLNKTNEVIKFDVLGKIII